MTELERYRGIIIIVLVFFLLSSYAVSCFYTESHSFDNNKLTSSCNFVNTNIINITADEAWIMLNCNGDGIQYPIDVRSDSEWRTEHIDTPPPENARHHCYTDWANQSCLNEFLNFYDLSELILYCGSGIRSLTASKILLNNGFEGTVYNMVGGLATWKYKGYPTKANSAPAIPLIQGPISGKIEESYQYTFSSSDYEGDQIYYEINWCNGTEIMYFGPYESGEYFTVDYVWNETGTYWIAAKTIDSYGDDSEWGYLQVSMPKKQWHFFRFFLSFIERQFSFNLY